MTEPKYLAQALAKYHMENKEEQRLIDLTSWLRYQYAERYLKLIILLGKEPKSFTQWLYTEIKDIQ